MKRFRIRRGQRAGILFVLPSLLGVAWFLLLPFLDVVARSFLGAVNGAVSYTHLDVYKRQLLDDAEP